MMQQNTPEWLDWRKTKIGASDAPIVMGVSPWCTPYQLWLEKLDLAPRKEMTPAMQRGLDLQDTALDEFSRMTGLQMFPEIRTHKEYDWMIASLDGITLDGQHMVEVKCPGEKTHKIALSGRIPDVYIPQLQHQMEVCGHEHMYYFSFDGTTGVVLDVFRDEEYTRDLVHAELRFFQCMRDGIPPESVEDDITKRDDDAWKKAEEEWIECQEAIERLEEREECLRKILIDLSEGKNCMGSKVKLKSVFRQGAVDYSKIEELKNLDLSPYRKKTSISWRLTHV